MTIHFAGWMIPTLITVLALFLPSYWTRNDRGMFSSVGTALFMLPCLFVAMISWIIYAIFK